MIMIPMLDEIVVAQDVVLGGDVRERAPSSIQPPLQRFDFSLAVEPLNHSSLEGMLPSQTTVAVSADVVRQECRDIITDFYTSFEDAYLANPFSQTYDSFKASRVSALKNYLKEKAASAHTAAEKQLYLNYARVAHLQFSQKEKASGLQERILEYHLDAPEPVMCSTVPYRDSDSSEFSYLLAAASGVAFAMARGHKGSKKRKKGTSDTLVPDDEAGKVRYSGDKGGEEPIALDDNSTEEIKVAPLARVGLDGELEEMSMDADSEERGLDLAANVRELHRYSIAQGQATKQKAPENGQRGAALDAALGSPKDSYSRLEELAAEQKSIEKSNVTPDPQHASTFYGMRKYFPSMPNITDVRNAAKQYRDFLLAGAAMGAIAVAAGAIAIAHVVSDPCYHPKPQDVELCKLSAQYKVKQAIIDKQKAEGTYDWSQLHVPEAALQSVPASQSVPVYDPFVMAHTVSKLETQTASIGDASADTQTVNAAPSDILSSLSLSPVSTSMNTAPQSQDVHNPVSHSYQISYSPTTAPAYDSANPAPWYQIEEATLRNNGKTLDLQLGPHLSLDGRTVRVRYDTNGDGRADHTKYFTSAQELSLTVPGKITDVGVGFINEEQPGFTYHSSVRFDQKNAV